MLPVVQGGTVFQSSAPLPTKKRLLEKTRKVATPKSTDGLLFVGTQRKNQEKKRYWLYIIAIITWFIWDSFSAVMVDAAVG